VNVVRTTFFCCELGGLLPSTGEEPTGEEPTGEEPTGEELAETGLEDLSVDPVHPVNHIPTTINEANEAIAPIDRCLSLRLTELDGGLIRTNTSPAHKYFTSFSPSRYHALIKNEKNMKNLRPRKDTATGNLRLLAEIGDPHT